MDEFLKINWGINDITELAQNNFLSEEYVKNSYVYRGLKKELQTLKSHSEASDGKEKKYIPGRTYFTQGNIPSKLTKLQQYRCLLALQIYQEGKDTKSLSLFEQECVNTFNQLRNLIQEENALFLEHVKKQWKFKKVLKAASYSYISKIWEKKLTRCLSYKQHYREHLMLSLSCPPEEEESLEMVYQKNVLEMGSLAKFSHPTLQTRCTLTMSSAKDDMTMTFNSKLPVSQDQNIYKLLENNDFDLVISSSALKRIMNSDSSVPWDIPIVVRKDRGKKIVYIDKALPPKRPTVRELNEKLHKILVKANLCQFEALHFEIKEDPIILSPETEDNKKSLDKSKVNNSSSEENVTSSLKINLSRHNVSYRIWSMKQKQSDSALKQRVKENELKLLVRCKLDACETVANDVLQPLVIVPKLEYQLGYGGEIPTKTELSHLWASLFFRPYSNSYRNGVLPLLNFINDNNLKKVLSKTYKLLDIICTTPMLTSECERCFSTLKRIKTFLQSTMVEDRLNALALLSIQKKLFSPYWILTTRQLRFFVAARRGEWTFYINKVKKLNNEAMHFYKMKPCLQLQVLYKIAQELVQLEPGDYLLHHVPKQGSFAALMKSCNTNTQSTLNLHEEYSSLNCGINSSNLWRPIDPNFILPMHVVYKRMPGMFVPIKKDTKKKGRKKKKKAPKKKLTKATNAGV